MKTAVATPSGIFPVLGLGWPMGHRHFSFVEMSPTLPQSGPSTPVQCCSLADIVSPQYLPCQRILLSGCRGSVYVRRCRGLMKMVLRIGIPLGRKLPHLV